MVSCDGRDSTEDHGAGKNAGHEAQLVLYREYRGGGPEHRQAYERLVMSLSGVVQRLASYYAARYRLDSEDLFQEGWLYGLVPAIDSFDETRAVKISTYVHGVVKRVLSKRAQWYARQRRRLALVGVDDDNLSPLVPLTEAGAEAEHRDLYAQLQDAIERAIAKLTKNERIVLRLKYGLTRKRIEQTDREIAIKLGRHRSRVSQIAEAARRKLMSDHDIRRIAREFGLAIDSLFQKRGNLCRRTATVGMQ